MMPKQISCSYFPVDIVNPKTREKVGVIYRPFITISIQSGYGQISRPFDALVDSGSDRNLFPLFFATEFLKLDFKKTQPSIIRGIGDSEMKAYRGKVNIWFYGHKFSTDADFSPSQNQPILGRMGFFNLFKSVKFDEGKRFTILEFKD